MRRSTQLALEYVLRDARCLRGARQVQSARDGVRRRTNRWKQPIQRHALAAKIREPAATLQDLQFPLEDVDRLAELRLHAGGSVRSDVRVGVFTIGQRHHM